MPSFLCLSARYSTDDVLSVCNSFQMGRPNTTSISAQVIKFEADWNRPVGLFVRPSVGGDHHSVTYYELPVILDLPSFPNPTIPEANHRGWRSVFGNLFPESLLGIARVALNQNLSRVSGGSPSVQMKGTPPVALLRRFTAVHRTWNATSVYLRRASCCWRTVPFSTQVVGVAPLLFSVNAGLTTVGNGTFWHAPILPSGVARW